MTVVRPNSIAGINSITVQTGQSLNIHDSDGNLIRNIVSATGVGTFYALSVGTAGTVSNTGNAALAGIVTANGGVVVGAAATIKTNGNATFSGIVTAASFVGDGSGLTGAGPALTGSTNNTIVTVTGSNAITGESTFTYTPSILTITNASGASEVTLVTPSANDSGIYFNDGSNSGALSYNHSDDSMRFRVNATEKARIDSTGRLIIGHTATDDRDGYNSSLQVSGTGGDDSSICIGRWSGDASASSVVLTKSRNGTIGSHTVVQANDILGMVQFQGDVGTNYHVGADIRAKVESGVGNDDVPASLIFSTNAGSTGTTQRMVIDSVGKIGFNDTTPTEGTVSIIQHDSSVTTTGLNIHTNGGSAGSGTQYALKITGTSQNDCPVYGIHIDKTQQYTQNVTGVYSKITATYSDPVSGHFIVHGTAMNTGGHVCGVKGEVMSDSGSNNNRKSRAVWAYNGTQQGSDTYGIQIDTVTGGNGDLRGIQVHHGGSTKFYVDSSGNVWSSTNSYSSDRDIKTDIQALSGTSLNLIKQLEPRTFKWRESEEDEKDGTIYKPDGATLTGFIAQEVQAVIPSIVTGTDGSKEMGINYQGLTAHLVNTIKELSSEIDTLKTKVAALESA